MEEERMEEGKKGKDEGRDGRRDGGKRREGTIKRKKRALYTTEFQR